MLPLASILLCLGLPALGLWQISRGRLRRPWLYTIGSFVFCGTGMLAELYTVRRRLFAGDVGGIEDTIDAAITICVVLLVIAALLNLMFLALSFAAAADGTPPEPENPPPAGQQE